MLTVECIHVRETSPDEIQVGKKYFMDETSINSLEEGDWYASIYDYETKKYLGRQAITQFKALWKN